MQEYAFQLFAHSASRPRWVCANGDVSRTLRCDSPRGSTTRRAVVERPSVHSPSHLGVRISRTHCGGADRRGVSEGDLGAVGIARIRAQVTVT